MVSIFLKKREGAHPQSLPTKGQIVKFPPAKLRSLPSCLRLRYRSRPPSDSFAPPSLVYPSRSPPPPSPSAEAAPPPPPPPESPLLPLAGGIWGVEVIPPHPHPCHRVGCSCSYCTQLD
ncbi:hypothetical protein DAI22_07g252650 [Oryza sativa Japonica Group]|nr:hypothetical protein DAI22_07g252650 [Oryza sativa Japonica Group]